MKPPYDFNLNIALALWRRSRESNRAFTADDLDELEQHLRDQVAGLVAGGKTLEEAFRTALEEMGDYGTAEKEYHKVYWGKLRRHRHVSNELGWRMTLFANYLKTAWRTILRQKGYALINISGLAVALACCLLIFLYVWHEHRFDRFHSRADRIYRVLLEEQVPDEPVRRIAIQSSTLGPEIEKSFPQILHAVRYGDVDGRVKLDDREYGVDIGLLDSSFFEVFSFPVVEGNATGALAAPNAIVLSATAAESYFGGAPTLGKRLTLADGDTEQDFTVTAVVRLPETSSIRFDVAIPFAQSRLYQEGLNMMGDDRFSLSYVTYVLLDDHARPSELEKAFVPFAAQHFALRVQMMREEERIGREENPIRLRLQPLTRLHLEPDVRFNNEIVNNPIYSYVLAAIAAVILLIASINFVTLSVARSAGRAREVGVRKVLGAIRNQLVFQFWAESLLLTTVSTLLGIGIAFLVLPLFNQLAATNLQVGWAEGLWLAVGAAALTGLVGLGAGSYPALFLSRFNPITVFKGLFRLSGREVLSKSLVVVQYTLSIALMACTFIIMRQMNHIRHVDLGFDQEQVVTIDAGEGIDVEQLIERLRHAMAGNRNVESVSGTDLTFGNGHSIMNWNFRGKAVSAWVFRVDPDYLKTLGIEQVSGRDFSRNHPDDARMAVIVNEALVNEFGLDDPVGEVLSGWRDAGEDPVIVGVTRNYNFQSLHESIKPAVLMLDPDWKMTSVLVRIRPENVQETLKYLETSWGKVAPGLPFVYRFLDQDIDRMYRAEQRWSLIVRYAAGLALFIACIGLLGLATLSVERRTREIGVRKVLGSSIAGLVVLLTREFVRLVALAGLVAGPLAFLVMSRWLDGFAYRIVPDPWVFILSATLGALIAFGTVSFQAIRAALANPVKALRYE